MNVSIALLSSPRVDVIVMTDDIEVTTVDSEVTTVGPAVITEVMTVGVTVDTEVTTVVTGSVAAKAESSVAAGPAPVAKDNKAPGCRLVHTEYGTPSMNVKPSGRASMSAPMVVVGPGVK